MSLKEPMLSPRAAELKAQANDLFKSGDFEKAFDVFTAAISEESQSPTLYSNRSAAAMKMKNFAQALKDAEKAVKLDPDWEKAHGRVAAAHECLHQFQSASYSYRKAASLAKDARQKNDYKNAAERLRSKIQAAVDGRMSEARTLDKDSMGLQKLRTLEAQGHTYPHDSAVWRHCWVTKGIKECWEGVQRLRIMTHMPDGSIVPKGYRRVYLDNGIFDSMLNLVASLLEDPTNSFLYPSNEPWTQPTKLVENLIFAYYQSPNAPRPNMTPSKTIKHFEQLQKEHGWDVIHVGMKIGVRSLLSASIRVSILRGIIYELLTGDFGSALQDYTRAYTLIGLARAKWPKQAEPNLAGTSLQRTFWRGVGARILECRLHLCTRNGCSSSDVDQIEQLATEQLQSCQKYPLPRPGPSDDVPSFVYWLAFDACLRAEAYSALAFVHRNRAQRKEKKVGKLTYFDPTESQRALEFYLHASAWYPAGLLLRSCYLAHLVYAGASANDLDDLNFARSLWRALDMQTRIGGVSLAAMDSMIASAKKSEEEFERFFGPVDRNKWDGRAEVLDHREKLVAKAAERNITDPSKIVLSAIPRYETAGRGGRIELERLINEAASHDNVAQKQEWDQGDETTTRMSIVEVLRNARQDRRRELDRTPAVYLDD